MTDLFYGPDIDGRTEKYRVARETKAKSICITSCSCRLDCLENALVLDEQQGVWGGMSESERYKFREHLRREGYDSIPEGDEFWAALHSFYRAMERDMEQRYA